MRDFSIDQQTEKIYSSKTKAYFNEVIKSYYGESYRSAVVMLYSIAIADLVYKIEELKELHNDENAIEIMRVIEDLQVRNPNSPDWETKLVELVKEKTNLLEPSDYLHLITLKNHRHLCAHPVLTQNFELYHPNKETTRAHIRNILEGILIKPPLLSRKIIADILLNLSTVKTIIYNDDQLEKHLKTRYFDKINQKVKKQIFRSLWKITFKTNSSEANTNRDINLRALNIMLKTDYQLLVDQMSEEVDYYSDIDVDNIGSFIGTLNRYPAIFNKLNDSSKILIENVIEKDADFDTYAVFLSENIEKHIEKVTSIDWNSPYEKNYITSESILNVFHFALQENKRDLAFGFIIKMFSNSNQYGVADSRFDNLIAPYLEEFTIKEFKLILSAINNNSQISDRRAARSTNQQIEREIKKRKPDFDFSKYLNLKL